jgi:hypothetical protein
MNAPLPLRALLDEWLRWAAWVSDPNRDESKSSELIGWNEFDWAVQDYPELAWQAILEAMNQPRMGPHLSTLAAGPLEDLLSLHGELFIDRVEAEARANPRFAWLLGGMYQYKMSEYVWGRVRSVWDRRGWDGTPTNDA